jgi:membrane protein YqaA with SNARE-associated domain
MAIIPAPAEIVVIPIVASTNTNPLAVAFVGTIGSVIGAAVDYWLGQKAFSRLDARFALTMKVRRFEKRFHRFSRYGLTGLLVMGRMFPVGTFLKPAMLLAGGTGYDKRTYFLVIAVSSFVRYLSAATVGSLLSYLMAHL